LLLKLLDAFSFSLAADDPLWREGYIVMLLHRRIISRFTGKQRILMCDLLFEATADFGWPMCALLSNFGRYFGDQNNPGWIRGGRPSDRQRWVCAAWLNLPIAAYTSFWLVNPALPADLAVLCQLATRILLPVARLAHVISFIAFGRSKLQTRLKRNHPR
jgi:hypothetical protein